MVTSPILADGRQCRRCATIWRHTALANSRGRFHKLGCCPTALYLVAIAIGWCREAQERCTDLAGPRARPAGAPSPGFSIHGSQSVVNLEAVLAADRPTIKHIPAKCKALWCAVLTRVLSSAVLATTSNNGHGLEEQAWAELLCLPKAVLSQAPRAGRRHPKCQENFTMCMLRSWLDGDKERLIAAASRAR